MVDIFNLQWVLAKSTLPKVISAPLRKIAHSWIFDSDSLTRKLKAQFTDFNVQLIGEKEVSLNTEFASMLGVTKALQREVYLCTHTTKLVYAISFIPTSCHTLLHLGDTPLGEVLFTDAVRTSMEVTFTGGMPGRRSVFMYKEHPVIVCEFFMSSLLTKLS